MDEKINESKKKVTFYLDKNSEDLLIDIFVNRLKSSNKSDKSAIICEAIALLHQKDIDDTRKPLTEEDILSKLDELRERCPEIQEYEFFTKALNTFKKYNTLTQNGK